MQAPTVRTAAATAGKAFISVSCGSAQGLLLPPLFDAMEVKRNWQTKVGALQLLEGWSKSAPIEVALSLPEIIPVASGCLADAKPQVRSHFLENVLVNLLQITPCRCRLFNCLQWRITF